MEWFWVLITITILFLFWFIYRIGFIRGYKTGARKVLGQWRHWLHEDDSDGADKDGI